MQINYLNNTFCCSCPSAAGKDDDERIQLCRSQVDGQTGVPRHKTNRWYKLSPYRFPKVKGFKTVKMMKNESNFTGPRWIGKLAFHATKRIAGKIKPLLLPMSKGLGKLASHATKRIVGKIKPLLLHKSKGL